MSTDTPMIAAVLTEQQVRRRRVRSIAIGLLQGSLVLVLYVAFMVKFVTLGHPL